MTERLATAVSVGRRLRRWAVRLLAAVGFLLVTVTCTPLLMWWAGKLAGRWDDPGGDVLVVLSAGVIAPDVLDATSQWRTLYAARAWKEGFRTVVVTGKDAAVPMKRLLSLYGVPESAVVVEGAATSTRENAEFTAPLLRRMAGRKVLLTSDYHMYRARRCFEKAGVSVEPRPYSDAYKRFQNWPHRWPVFFELAGESAKILWYRWKGWI